MLPHYHVSSTFVNNFLSKLPNKKSLDVLNMDCILLKAAAPDISLSLSHVINLTIIKGVLRVTPIYKGQGSLTEPGNYRPISVVSTITKLLETAVKEQLLMNI